MRIEGDEFFPVLRPPHGYSARESAQVVGVDGLTHFQHHIVGDVHGKGDGTHAGKRQPGHHKRRRGPVDRDSSNHSGNEYPAPFNAPDGGIVLESYGETLARHGSHRCGGITESRTRSVMIFPGNTPDGQRISTIRRDIHFHGNIVKA